jgi:hypothetical protein
MTARAATQATSSVVAKLTYCLKKPEKLVYKITEMGEEDPETYDDWYVRHAVPISDARPQLSSLSLDHEGFVLRRLKTAVGDFYDEDAVRRIYDVEIERLILRETGAEKAMIFDHTIRTESESLRRERRVRETVLLVHNDYTVSSGPQRVCQLLDADEASIRLKRRFAIYNLWQPIRGPVLSSPLALCDAQSVAPEDRIGCDLDYGDRVGEIYNFAFNPDHRWYYVPNMQADEVLIFKNFDSREDGTARFTPHTAFDHPTSPPGVPPRESIETRVLAFFPPGA